MFLFYIHIVKTASQDASKTISNNHEPAEALKMNRNLKTLGNGQNDYQCVTLFTKEFDPD